VVFECNYAAFATPLAITLPHSSPSPGLLQVAMHFRGDSEPFGSRTQPAVALQLYMTGVGAGEGG
jgi:hypothetical protein